MDETSHMTFAVVQKNLEPPSIRQLKNAFQGIPGLTAVDAAASGRDPFGILARGFEQPNAAALAAALADQGVDAEVVADDRLPGLPPDRHVNRLECTPEALVIYDPLGRAVPLEWRHVGLIAAGKVAMEEFKRVGEEKVVWQRKGRSVGRQKVTEYHTEESRHERLLLEIVIRGGRLRYSTNADQWGHLLFQYLGDRRSRNLLQNFRLLVEDLVQRSPQAAVNRGAQSLRENAGPPFCYHSKSAFYEEIIWLLWQMKRQSEPEII